MPHWGANRSIARISIDSRTTQVGDTFVALQGTRDGHTFIKAALAKGASSVVFSDKRYQFHAPNIGWLQVADTTLGLGQIAKLWRAQFHLPVIGITGSCGKTTVKEMLGQILTGQGNSLITQGNLNNQLGVPLTLLQLQAKHHSAILEMGASQPGDIAYLAELAQPSIGIITHIGAAHLQGFGSLAGIAKAKAALYAALPVTGTAVINLDLPYAKAWQQQLGERFVVTFGLDPNAMVRAKAITLHPQGSQFQLILPYGQCKIQLQVAGQHNILNALAAAAGAYAANASLAQIKVGLNQFTGIAGRLQWHQVAPNITLIDDSYNANPSSVEAAIRLLAQVPGEKVLVLGEMAELADYATLAHQQMGTLAKSLGIQWLFAVGLHGSATVEAFGQQGLSYDSQPALICALQAQLKPGMTVLVKGSRSAHMEQVIDALLS